MGAGEAASVSFINGCWCGNTGLDVYSPDYYVCTACGTLISRLPTPTDAARPSKDEDFYGASYWYSHQERHLQQPTITDRARDDLTRRCLWWLRTLLKYCMPPARILELGSAHGGFVALLRRAGFDATGLEISPDIVRFARRTFGVPMLQGPIEQQALQGSSFDVIVLMDVLEHLEEPVQTLRHCLQSLDPNGLLLIQTPCFPREATYDDLRGRDDPFLRMLMPEEHRYLFSAPAIEIFFDRLGASNVVFEPAAFPHYDMFVVASRRPLHPLTSDAGIRSLEVQPDGRFVAALLDLEERERTLLQRVECATADLAARDRQLGDALRWFTEANTDRAARLEQVNTLVSALQESRNDREARGGQIDRLAEALRVSEEDREARWNQIQTLTEALLESEADRRERWKQIQTLTAALEQSETNRRSLTQQLGQARAEIVDTTAAIDDLRDQALEASTRIGAAQGEPQTAQAMLHDIRLTFENERAERRQLELEKFHTANILRTIRRSRWYRLLVWSGRWSSLETALSTVGIANEPSSAGPGVVQVLVSPDEAETTRSLRSIAVDLTPVLPGGDNGGAKVFALRLILELAALLPDCHFILLTSATTHDELAAFDRRNVRRICVSRGTAPPRHVREALRDKLAATARRVIPQRLRPRLRQVLVRTKQSLAGGLLQSLGVEVLLCPFTAPYYYEPGIPCVCVLYDLQHRAYPEFFSPLERAERDHTFLDACRCADRLVCISSYVRETVVAQGTIVPDRVCVAHLSAIQHEIRGGHGEQAVEALGVVPDRYLFYPANFWRHKNHEMLLLAMANFRARHPDSDLTLVCTGALGARSDALRQAANRMGLGRSVVFTGYVTDNTYAQLVARCRALVFPSLYEGFGIPPIEAMALGRPVACSGTTSLPEVTSGAALLFDPRKPDGITEAIERLEFDEDLRRDLIARGHQRVESLGNMRSVAEEYVRILDSVLGAARDYRDGIAGLYEDGWTQERVVITYGSAAVIRRVELELEAPGWTAAPSVTVEVRGRDVGHAQYHIRRGARRTITIALPSGSGYFELIINPLSRPAAFGVGTDERLLGCLCRSCRFVSHNLATELLARTA